jgi:BirA family biotin operon repressor/biotin-[acetyl-CoA-carboxylase] ligase
MQLIKLDAIDSTNDFLKALSSAQVLENFTIVTAENQQKGKGQMGAVWNSEPSKNLIMSVLISNFITDINKIYTLNLVVSVSIIQALEVFSIPELSIKWPNDIMSHNKKIGGILIENTIKSNGTINSIVGLGLNVNQINFENLPHASSLSLISGTTFIKEDILMKIAATLKENIQDWNQRANSIATAYTNKLFKKGIPMTFVDRNQHNFIGTIKNMSSNGKLEIILQDGSVSQFDIKEIQMLY